MKRPVFVPRIFFVIVLISYMYVFLSSTYKKHRIMFISISFSLAFAL